jgi:hypothetical protein
MAKAGPPGWAPHQLSSRTDGWLGGGDDPCHPPRAVAEVIARAMPQIGDGNTVADIRARMLARQTAHDRAMARRCAQDRIIND